MATSDQGQTQLPRKQQERDRNKSKSMQARQENNQQGRACITQRNWMPATVQSAPKKTRVVAAKSVHFMMPAVSEPEASAPFGAQISEEAPRFASSAAGLVRGVVRLCTHARRITRTKTSGKQGTVQNQL